MLPTNNLAAQSHSKETTGNRHVFTWPQKLGLGPDRDKRRAVAKAVFWQINPPTQFGQVLLPWGAMWTFTAQRPHLPFDNVPGLRLVPALDQAVLTLALVALSMTAIDIIVTLPLVAGWTGIFTFDQAALAIMLALAGHACFSPSALVLLAPRSADDPLRWHEEHPIHATLRSWLVSGPLLILGIALIILRDSCDQWAAAMHADPTLLFTTICLGACTALAGALLIIRQAWDLGDRASDDLFREIFWALLGIFIAFIPATFLANWAPTLLGAIAVPLIITRSRISAAKAAETRPVPHPYWQEIRPAAVAEGSMGLDGSGSTQLALEWVNAIVAV